MIIWRKRKVIRLSPYQKQIKKEGKNMNKKCVELLKEVINNNYHNVRLDNISYDDNEFYYEFK